MSATFRVPVAARIASDSSLARNGARWSLEFPATPLGAFRAWIAARVISSAEAQVLYVNPAVEKAIRDVMESPS